jgi:small subunit ribosomal protein S6
MPFLQRDFRQVLGNVRYRDPPEIEHLATAQDGGEDLVFLRGGQDEDGVGGRLLQCFQEGVEGRRAQHVYLVDDVHLLGADLRRDLHLLDQVADVVDAVVAGGIQLEDVQRMAIIEAFAGRTFAAGAQVIVEVLAVDGARQDARTGGLPTPRGPVKRKAEATCWFRMAFFSVPVTCSWPTTVSNRTGRYLRALTTYRSMGGAKIMASGETSHKPQAVSLELETYGLQPIPQNFANPPFPCHLCCVSRKTLLLHPKFTKRHMTNRYETVFILTPVLSEDQAKEAVTKFKDLLKEGNGKVRHEENWGMRKLAYPIQKKSSGFYHLIEFESDPSFIAKLETEYRRDERVIRFLTVAMDKHHVAFAESRRGRSGNAEGSDKPARTPRRKKENA